MKTKAAKQPNKSKLAVKMQDLKPKKETKGGSRDSFYGTGVYKSVDGGRTW